MSLFSSTTWVQYTFSYAATKTDPVLQFTFNNGGTSTYLDEVSVVDSITNSTQLLLNPSFENSASVPPSDWVTWCTYTCQNGTAGRIVRNSTACHSSTGNSCFMNQCTYGYEFLGQQFLATVGQHYIISFWLRLTSGGTVQFYADIA
ncbi:unnamed protein product [Rotaria sp. Silwood1]|nr:unnamed protein product [Rotaria sp. Silwood1]